LSGDTEMTDVIFESVANTLTNKLFVRTVVTVLTFMITATVLF